MFPYHSIRKQGKLFFSLVGITLIFIGMGTYFGKDLYRYQIGTAGDHLMAFTSEGNLLAYHADERAGKLTVKEYTLGGKLIWSTATTLPLNFELNQVPALSDDRSFLVYRSIKVPAWELVSLRDGIVSPIWNAYRWGQVGLILPPILRKQYMVVQEYPGIKIRRLEHYFNLIARIETDSKISRNGVFIDDETFAYIAVKQRENRSQLVVLRVRDQVELVRHELPFFINAQCVQYHRGQVYVTYQKPPIRGLREQGLLLAKLSPDFSKVTWIEPSINQMFPKCQFDEEAHWWQAEQITNVLHVSLDSVSVVTANPTRKRLETGIPGIDRLLLPLNKSHPLKRTTYRISDGALLATQTCEQMAPRLVSPDEQWAAYSAGTGDESYVLVEPNTPDRRQITVISMLLGVLLLLAMPTIRIGRLLLDWLDSPTGTVLNTHQEGANQPKQR